MTRQLRIAIAGIGTVGSSVIALIEQQRDLLRARAGCDVKIVAVAAGDLHKKRAVDLSGYRLETDALAFAAAADIDVVVELIGGAEGAARALAEASLSAGKHLVTANKALIATHGARLAEIAAGNKLALLFEAAVAGGIPIIKLLCEGLAANRISRVSGILNGTCNYILTHMWEQKRSFDDMLAEAQKLGYAEADCGFDVDGIDAAHKLAILAALAYGRKPDISAVNVQGIRGVTLHDMSCADELGYVIRLLGVATGNDVPSVYPALVAKNSNLASVRDVFNAIELEADSAGTIFIKGRGAGGAPTASAVVADIVDIARGNYNSYLLTDKFADKAVIKANGENKCEYYIRFSVIDKQGVLADITAIFRDCGISLKSFLQHGQAKGENVYIVVATHETTLSEIKTALAKIAQQPSVTEAPVYMRIL